MLASWRCPLCESLLGVSQGETPGPCAGLWVVLLRMSLLSEGTLSSPSCIPSPLTGLSSRGWLGSGLQVPGIGAAHLAVFLGPAFLSSVQLPRWQTYLPKA